MSLRLLNPVSLSQASKKMMIYMRRHDNKNYTIIKELLFNIYLIYNYLMCTEIFRQHEF